MKKTTDTRSMKLMDLKDEGHRIIDALVAAGISRDHVYFSLRKRLKCKSGKEHFAAMNTIEEAKLAVQKLKRMRMQYIHRRQQRESRMHPEDRTASLELRKNLNLVTRGDMRKKARGPHGGMGSVVLSDDLQRRAYEILRQRNAEKEAWSRMSTWERWKWRLNTVFLHIRRYAHVSQTEGAAGSQDPYAIGGSGGSSTLSVRSVDASSERDRGASPAREYSYSPPLDYGTSPGVPPWPLIASAHERHPDSEDRAAG